MFSKKKESAPKEGKDKEKNKDKEKGKGKEKDEEVEANDKDKSDGETAAEGGDNDGNYIIEMENDEFEGGKDADNIS